MTFPEHQAGGDNLARRYQPEDGQQWQFPDMPGVPGVPGTPAQPALSAPPTQRRTGLRTGGWITVIVATLAAVAMVVWLGLTTSQFPTPTVEERHALERVQTPDEAPPAPVEESNVLVLSLIHI